ncbi:uncharacterized protein LOC120121549 [Hibiscus syriacus]|uniref:uncharacterized protein LOC120121549 n=1 Tax=Hibiscus syriacus TaxID=106335 RepID=UPI001923A3CE|nr:uncharacterized protein LOC120121549 [Hibiscus syriacus]
MTKRLDQMDTLYISSNIPGPLLEMKLLLQFTTFSSILICFSAFNTTTIVLIPKIPNPCKVKDFKPISCCSDIYKAITKILVKRMSSLMPGMISLNQSAFIKGMSIVDNILLAQEVVKGYGRKNISPRCTMKIDLQKTFDTLHWNFIISVLKALDIPQRFIGWIQACFTEARFSISFNGSLVGFFKGARTIRQDDPLSPFLFVLSLNMLSRLLNLAAARRLYNYHPKCKQLGLTHLSFADDLLIFCKGNAESVACVISVLDKYYEISWLNLNAAKCVFFTASVENRTVEKIKQFTSFNIGCLPVRYLVIPIITRKLSIKDYDQLIDNIKSKLNLWSGKMMSFAGRLELIRAVLFCVSNFWCRSLLLPQAVINKIDQLHSRFFWKGSDKAATGARVSWEKICQLKSEGGLGLKNLKSWNKACIIKLIKNILAGEGSLWVSWIKTNILKEKNFWHIEGSPNFSWSFNRILKLWPEALLVITNRTLTIKHIWMEIRMNGDKVKWQSLIWYPYHILKLSIITWMAILDRLPTRDRLLRIGITTLGDCVLCNEMMENMSHLFFECPMAANLWDSILLHNGLKKPISTWEDMITWESNT